MSDDPKSTPDANKLVMKEKLRLGALSRWKKDAQVRRW